MTQKVENFVAKRIMQFLSPYLMKTLDLSLGDFVAVLVVVLLHGGLITRTYFM